MTYDIVIVGGGLSGLALAVELAQAEFSNLRVLVLEQRTHYIRDRTWSYWTTPHDTLHRYSSLERKQWDQWRVRQGPAIYQHGPTAAKEDSGTRYCTIDSDAFYTAAQQAIAQSSHVTLRLGTPVRRITGGNIPSVETSSCEVISASWIFDARPPAQSIATDLVQQFAGCEIKTDKDVFDPATVDLMHFEQSTAGLHFFYVLPYSPRNALVETTWISPAAHKPDFGAELQQFIAKVGGSAAYEVVYEERGSLNLSPSRLTPHKGLHVAPLGRGAGTLRASTGYAFLETLEHAKNIAASLKNHATTDMLGVWVPAVFKRQALDEWMDTVFLKVLAQNWRESPRYFMLLFKQLDAHDMVAFLSGRANWRQRLLVSRVLPTWPFASQALATAIDGTSRLLRARR